jgi:hypothetical protein
VEAEMHCEFLHDWCSEKGRKDEAAKKDQSMKRLDLFSQVVRLN